MLTYVINTSENRTLDSDRLFDLAGYSKIRWINCSLSEIDQCAQHIFERQNILGADSFRIAVIVDFFNFDRVRQPYGRTSYIAETGVDINLYLPYIEIYLLDKLMAYLEKRELRAEDFEVYYVQNTKLETYDFVNNAKTQLREILSGYAPDGYEPTALPSKPEEKTEEEKAVKGRRSRTKKAEELPEEQIEEDNEEDVRPGDELLYPAFSLYCSKSVSLRFNLTDYPYGTQLATFPQFLELFGERISQKYDVRRHFYISSYGGGPARAALDTLTLSLHLIRMYEREESAKESNEEIEINRIDAESLKDVLVSAWNKIYLARNAATTSGSIYYSLKDNVRVDEESLQPRYQSETAILTDKRMTDAYELSPKELYRRISYLSNRTPAELARDKRTELDRLMNDYLVHRDEVKEFDVKKEFEESKRDGSLQTTTRFPSEEEYLHTVKEKQQEISTRFENVLAANYVQVDFSDEMEMAEEAYTKYNNAKACLRKNIIFDAVFLVLTVLSAVVPYIMLQLSSHTVKTITSVFLGAHTTGLFACVFVIAFIIQMLTLSIRFSRAKEALRCAYQDAYRKEFDSMVQLRMKYTEDLLFIERTRYELRQLKCLYEANIAKDVTVKLHRELLEELEGKLGSMLNNLDVEPVLDADESISGEFDINKPIRSRENRIYKIFSIETIEKLFKRKGRNE